MELDGYVDRLRAEFAAISEVAGPEVRDVAERLITPLGSATRLVLLEALAAAADEITLDLAPGSVHLRLRDSDPDFVVTPGPGPVAHGGPTAPTDPPAPTGPPMAPPTNEADAGPTARINFRPPETLKTRIEEAAAADGLSVNTWLTRVASAALVRPPHRQQASERGRLGWFG